MASHGFEFDFVISYASEDKEFAQELRNALADVKVFYAPDFQAETWGENLYEYLSDIYSKKGRFCLLLISEHFVKKKWTRHEWKNAQERILNDIDKTYLLPIRLDNTDLPGLITTIGYLDATDLSATDIAHIATRKLSLSQIDEDEEGEDEDSASFSGFGIPPPQPKLFIGREEEVIELKNKLTTKIHSEAEQSIVVMQGWPGIGKTALAQKIGSESNREGLFDGVFWAELGEDADPYAVLARWGKSLKLDDSPAQVKPQDIREKLLDKSVLFVVDDVWENQGEIFRRAAGPQCSILFTTRFEHVARLLAPSDDAIHVLTKLSETSSLKLLEAIIPTIVRKQADECQKLVQFLGGSPLALQVAGWWLHEDADESWGITNLLEEIEEDPTLLDRETPEQLKEMSGRTAQTVDRLLYKSIKGLEPKIQSKFSLLGAFTPRGIFDKEAISKTWEVEDPKPAIKALRRRGLLKKVPGGYRIHNLLIYYARSLAHNQSQNAFHNARYRNASHYSEILRDVNLLFRQGGSSNISTAQRLLNQAWEQIRWGQQWAVEHATEDALIQELVVRYWKARNTLNLRQNARERIALFKSVLEVFRQENNVYNEAECLNALGLAYGDIGELKTAGNFHGQAVLLYRKMDYKVGEVNSLGNLGIVYARQEQFQEANVYFKQSADLHYRMHRHHRQSQAHMLGNIGIIHKNLAKLELAMEVLNQSLEISEELGDRLGQGRRLSDIGNVYAMLQQFQKAIEYYNQALEINSEVGDHISRGHSYQGRSESKFELGILHEAKEDAEQALNIRKETGDRFHEAITEGLLGDIYLGLENTKMARECYHRAITIAQELGLGKIVEKITSKLNNINIE